ELRASGVGEGALAGALWLRTSLGVAAVVVGGIVFCAVMQALRNELVNAGWVALSGWTRPPARLNSFFDALGTNLAQQVGAMPLAALAWCALGAAEARR